MYGLGGGGEGKESCGVFKVLRIHSQSFKLVTVAWLKRLVSNLVLKLISYVLKPTMFYFD